MTLDQRDEFFKGVMDARKKTPKKQQKHDKNNTKTVHPIGPFNENENEKTEISKI